jgi:hypothetical protein
MSGIEKMMKKMKSKKMTLDDLPAPSVTSELQKSDKQQNIKTVEQYAVHTSVQTAVHTDEQPINTVLQENGKAAKQRTKEAGRARKGRSIAVHTDEQHLKTETPHYSNAEKLQSVNTVVQHAVNEHVEDSDADLQDDSNTVQHRATNVNTAKQSVAYLGPQTLVGSAQQSSNTEIQHYTETANIPHLQIPIRKEESKFAQVKKVTYYLTEEMYKAFNDVYARRILEGRKTDKSTLISEAVELLYKHEMQNRQ